MRLLLHACCAPCFIYPLEKLREKGFTVSGFFYNPNIQPFEEYAKRKQAVIDFSRASAAEVKYPEYSPSDFIKAISRDEEKPARCLACWELRLKATAESARESNLDAFSTTLLVSPYQDQGALREIGARVSREAGIEFFYEDFRPGFRRAHDEAKARGIYCQNYCGCLKSKIDRCKKPQRR